MVFANLFLPFYFVVSLTNIKRDTHPKCSIGERNALCYTMKLTLNRIKSKVGQAKLFSRLGLLNAHGGRVNHSLEKKFPEKGREKNGRNETPIALDYGFNIFHQAGIIGKS